MIIRNQKIKEQEFDPIKVKQLFVKGNKSVSFVEIRLSGKNLKSKNTDSDVYYYVVEGRGKFVINNNEYLVKTGDLIIINKGTAYYDEGEMKLFSISIPAFNRKNTKYLD